VILRGDALFGQSYDSHLGLRLFFSVFAAAAGVDILSPSALRGARAERRVEA
jgi:hypothetical protein